MLHSFASGTSKNGILSSFYNYWAWLAGDLGISSYSGSWALGYIRLDWIGDCSYFLLSIEVTEFMGLVLGAIQDRSLGFLFARWWAFDCFDYIGVWDLPSKLRPSYFDVNPPYLLRVSFTLIYLLMVKASKPFDLILSFIVSWQLRAHRMSTHQSSSGSFPSLELIISFADKMLFSNR